MDYNSDNEAIPNGSVSSTDRGCCQQKFHPLQEIGQPPFLWQSVKASRPKCEDCSSLGVFHCQPPTSLSCPNGLPDRGYFEVQGSNSHELARDRMGRQPCSHGASFTRKARRIPILHDESEEPE